MPILTNSLKTFKVVWFPIPGNEFAHTLNYSTYSISCLKCIRRKSPTNGMEKKVNTEIQDTMQNSGMSITAEKRGNDI